MVASFILQATKVTQQRLHSAPVLQPIFHGMSDELANERGPWYVAREPNKPMPCGPEGSGIGCYERLARERDLYRWGIDLCDSELFIPQYCEF